MSRENHKILYLTKGGDVSGAQRQLLYLLKGLDKKRFTPVVLCTSDGRFVKELEDAGIRCFVRRLAGWRKVKHLFSRYRDAAYVCRLVKSEGVSLVHASDIWLSEYMLRSAQGANIPSVLHIRAPVDRRTFKKHRCAMATVLVPISKRVEMRLYQTANASKDKIVLIHDAVDANLFKPRDCHSDGGVFRKQYAAGDTVLVGIVGRVEKGKEQLGFAGIAGDIVSKTKTKKAAFFIIGDIKDHSYYSQIAKYIKDNDLLDHIHFTGRRNDMPDVLAGLDVLVSLSGGSVRYEAMMCGITVVCAWSRRTEESYHIRHGETGFLVTRKELKPVTEVLLKVIEDADLRRRIGANARKWAQDNLNHSLLVESTQRLYERLLQR
ncbi:MAG TPA: glycosyltransferase family 4 protein [Sedimentisphaerales bacterium]|nr:glycosyltransferase family 4 protein [Sedimentisphaerales bacterium]